jgi:hypothetical protein
MSVWPVRVPSVIPGPPQAEPGIQTASAAAWIPASREAARPGMTFSVIAFPRPDVAPYFRPASCRPLSSAAKLRTGAAIRKV